MEQTTAETNTAKSAMPSSLWICLSVIMANRKTVTHILKVFIYYMLYELA